MGQNKNIFTRVEKKYVITDKQYSAIIDVFMEHMKTDKFGVNTICSIYYDTPDMRIIRASILKPVYKEKLRVRCYGVPNDNSETFIELKKKYKGVVYKRRIGMTYAEHIRFFNGDFSMLKEKDQQIGREIAYALNFYPGISPAYAIFCERLALFDKTDDSLRLTIDKNLRYRIDDFDLRHGSAGKLLLPEDRFVMEIKTAFAMPLWLTELLDKNKIYPRSFSKFGTAYEIELKNKLNRA